MSCCLERMSNPKKFEKGKVVQNLTVHLCNEHEGFTKRNNFAFLPKPMVDVIASILAEALQCHLHDDQYIWFPSALHLIASPKCFYM